MRYFDKYKGELRSFRPIYFINNLLNYHKLKHNKELYKKYNIRKNIFGSISSNDFLSNSAEAPWLDNVNTQARMQKSPQFNEFNEAIREELLKWPERGYLELRNFFKEELIDEINKEVESLLRSNKLVLHYSKKRILFAHRQSRAVDNVFRDQQLLKILQFILGKKIMPFQTIYFLKASEQRAHSDAIHMTTEPKGFLIAVWVALEDVNEDNGPLFYYPGSHKLRYVMSSDFNNGNTSLWLGKNYGNYEDKIEELIAENKLAKQEFHAKKGDVFIWHANILHGGSKVKNKNTTRKSMVSHYFCEDVICYHELTQRPALLDKKLIL
ncbi:phytanoyl-CoA dioxygenase family protein [Candidatus Amoebophilus asiaticus]|nr:phytanoyl-CoA dioxygenase family protein [Candidatus Amoebophilus asiaticus]